MAGLRISGIMSGFDTETMIKDLMKAESAKLDKVKKDRQYVSWQQEGFREIINKLKTFQSNYFDVLKPTTNFTSTASFAKFAYIIKSGGVDTDKVSVIAGADVKSKAITINKIDQLASKDTWTGASSGIRGIETSGTAASYIGDLSSNLTSSGKNLEFTLSIGSNAKVISVDPSTFSDADTLASALDTKIQAAFGSDYAGMVTSDGTDLKFDFSGNEVKILKYGDNVTSMTGLFGSDAAQSSYAYKTKSLNTLLNLTDAQLGTIQINGKTIALDQNDTISKMIEKVNASDANVTLSYDALNDKFTLKSNLEGSANNISIEDGSDAENLFTNLFGVSDLSSFIGSPNANTTISLGNGDESTRSVGKNAKLSINGVDIIQSSNNFSLDGVNYSLKATSTDPIDISIETDTTSIIDNIKNFVKEYNEIVDFINGKLTEKRDYDYDPLTDDEKEALSEEEITKWENKAKQGMLKGSSELSSMLTELRNAIIEPIEGVGITMAQIGISSTSYADKGKLTIDETKLKSALENNYEEVVNLFTKKSDITYNDSANRNQRDNENGISNRFDDILKDYIRTTRDSNGYKGKLIVKAGIENDSSQFSNDFQKKLTGYDDRISDLLDYLSNREEYYYTMFSKMESALSQMESQSSSLLSQLGQ